ncbi:hypothetical protein D8M20_02965 [Corynebacterium propinquum]|nr:hypothetical protein D8M24_03450 [Corynebacterium propinquum]RUP89888.1 hypothetical protein D8M40_02965 [Corynebacterium propinquum]RUP96442.1 hypothetical protein D8M20_02965 [Corynebacterium propinquum]
MLAASVTGLLLSILANGLGWPFLLCFLVAAVFVTLFVEPESLFLTVAPLPLFFGIFAFFTSWASNAAAAPEGANWASRTMVWTSIYAVVEYFPALALITVLTIAIAVVRLMLLRGQAKIHDRSHRQRRSSQRESDRRNIRSASRARERTNRVTVEELMARNRADNATRSPVRSSRLPQSQTGNRLHPRPEPQRQPQRQPQQQPRNAETENGQTEYIRPAEPRRTVNRRSTYRQSATDAQDNNSSSTTRQRRTNQPRY